MKHLQLYEHFPAHRAEDIPEDEDIHRLIIVGGQDEEGNDLMILIEGREDNDDLPPADLDEWAEELTNVTLEKYHAETLEDMLALIDFIQEDLEFIQEHGYTVRFPWKEWENMDMKQIRELIDQALDRGDKEAFQRLSKRLK